MIRQLFLPDKIKGYYLFAKRIVGIDIGKTHISATQIYVRGKSTIIEKYVEEKIENGTGDSYNERAIAALKIVLAQLDKYDTIYTALSSSVAIFKELKLPFLTYDKIKMVVNYEIEPLLPFPISDAVVDFIVTKQNVAEGSSEILVAAVQNQHLIAHLAICEGAGISPEIITIDLFALYGLYKKIPSYASWQGNTVLIDLGLQATRMAFIQDGQLRFIRTVNKGTLHATKTIGQALDMQQNEIMENMMRFGLENSNNQRYMQAATQTFNDFWSEIQFTLQSFTAQTASQQPLNKIILLGGGAEIKGIPEFVTSLLGIPCELMHITDILQDPSISIKNHLALPSSSIISVSTAIQSPLTENFNLRQGVFATSKEGLLEKQLITAALFALILMGSLGVHSFLQVRKFRNDAYSYQHEALELLKARAHFAQPLQEGLKNIKEDKQLAEAVAIADDTVKKQEQMWGAFTGSARATILKYLLELTNRIDKDSLGFTIESLAIAEGSMTLKASVKNHEALRILEKELKQSKLFAAISSPEETTFTMKITLTKNGEE